MPRKPDERIEQAREMFQNGVKLIDIAKQLDLPEGTVRRWKSTHKWDNERSDKNSERSDRKKDKKKNKTEAAVHEKSETDENTGLTDKQRLFCIYFVRCFNATKAYQKAYGVGYETAAAAGARMLRNVKIKNQIQELKQNRLNRDMLGEEDIFQKYMDIAFADITDYVEFGNEEQPVIAMYGPVKVENEDTGEKEVLMKKVNVVRFKESSEVDGTIILEVKQGKDGAGIKLADRMKALQWLSDHMGIATEEQRRKIELLKAQTQRLSVEPQAGDEDGVEIINDAPKEAGSYFGDCDPEVHADI